MLQILVKPILEFIGFFVINIAAGHYIGYVYKSKRMIKINIVFRICLFAMIKREKLNIWPVIAQVVNVLALLINVILFMLLSIDNVELLKAIILYPVLMIYSLMTIDILFLEKHEKYIN